MAELRSSNVLAKQDTKNKKIDNRLTELEGELATLETDIDNRLNNLELTKKIKIAQWHQYQNSEWYYCSMSEDAVQIVRQFDAVYKPSNSESNYIFQFYLRLANNQLTYTKITYSASEYYLYFGETILRMRMSMNMFMINRSDVGSCQLVLHYSLL